MYNVLLVDDEENILQGIREIIDWEQYGFQIAATAYDGEEAIRTLKQGGIDMVITDIRMRPGDGISIAREIYQNQLQIPVIVLSAYRDFEYARSCMEYGVEYYLLKPVEENKLIETIQSVFQKLNSRKQYWRIQNADSIYRAVLKPEWPEDDIILNQLKQLKMPSNAKRYGILLLHTQCDLSGDMIRQVDSTLQSLNIGVVIQKEKNSLISLCWGENTASAQILLNQAIQSLPCHWSGFMGKWVDRLEQLHYSYVSAKNIHIAEVGKQHHGILSFHDFQQSLSEDSFAKLWSVEKLHNAVDIGTREDLQRELEQCMAWLRNKCAGVNELRMIVADIIEMLVDDSEECDHWLSQTSKAYNLEQMVTLLQDVCDCCYQRIRQEKQNAGSDVVRRVNQIIAEYYGDPALSIKMIAGKMGYNSSYLGRIYAAQSKTSIKNQIYRYRMEQAKNLLRTTQDKIIDVAYAVGITDLNLFYRLFREIVKTTPKDYRNQQ